MSAMQGGRKRKRGRERKVDRAQLRSFIGKGNVSMHGLEGISKAFRANPEAREALETCTRRNINDTNAEHFNNVKTSLEVRLTKGRTFTWELCDPGALMAYVIERDEVMQDLGHV